VPARWFWGWIGTQVKNTSVARTAIVVAACAIVYTNTRFVVPENEIVVVTRFGKARRSVAGAAVRFRIPFVERLVRFEKTPFTVAFDQSVPCREKIFLKLDTRASCRIADGIKYYKTLNNIRLARRYSREQIASAERQVITDLALRDIVQQQQADAPVGSRAGSQVLDQLSSLVKAPLSGKGLALDQVEILVSYDKKLNVPKLRSFQHMN
jgi:regulator of protease activity HflC (stomatin/prohibitin superfamily)